MTNREKAIVMAYTGKVMLAGDNLGDFYRYVEEKLGRPIMTHELAFQEVRDALADAAKGDFIELAKSDNSHNNGWISVKDKLPDAAGYECLVCAVNENYNQTHVFTAHTGYGEPGWWTGNVHYMSRATSPSDNRLHPALKVTHWMPLPEPPAKITGGKKVLRDE